MSLIDSWFPQRKHRRSNDSELPLWHEQHHLPRPFPPTSLAASMYQSALTHQDKSKAISPMSEDLNVLRRKEKALHLKLQELLDEQSEGLLAGLGMKERDGDEGGRNTPTTTRIQRSNSLSLRPTHRRQRKPALGTTRRAIWKAILECAELKAEEDVLVKEELEENRFILGQLEGWDVKRDGLRKTIEEIGGEDSKAKAKSLKQEAMRLHEEILDLEAKLAQMKMRHRQLLEEVDEMENEGQSKLSSYKASLDLVEKDITHFLKNPPTHTRKESPFMALPPKRRTLDMAKEYWETEYTQMERNRKSAKRDRKALEEGAVVWKDVVAEILSFERFLAKEMGNMNQSMLDGRTPSPAESKLGPAEILSQMNSTMKYIEDRLRLAEKKKWRLLEACIGAELEAFKQGKDMLEQIFSEGEFEAEQKEEEDSPPEELFKEDADQEELGEGLLGNLGTNGSGLQQQSLYDTDDDDDDDDGPSADLMVSRGGDDTD